MSKTNQIKNDLAEVANNFKSTLPQQPNEIHQFMRGWKRDWQKLGWNALIPAVILVAFFVGVFVIIHNGR
jgi:hypothetical protein